MSPYLKWSCAVAAGVVAAYITATGMGFLLLLLACLLGAVSLPRHFWN